MKYETWAPMFPGFYNTSFEFTGEDDEIREYNQENKTELGYDDFEWDYRDYEERVSKAFCERLEKELNKFLPIKIKYQTISSPKEYNFKNDSINIEVKLSLPKLMKLIKDRYPEAEGYFLNTYSSRPGFIPYHSNDIDDWLKKEYIMEKPAHRIGALLECLCEIEMDPDDIYWWVEHELGYISFTPKEKEEV